MAIIKKDIVGTIVMSDIYKKIRNDFHRPIRTESNKKKAKRAKNKLHKEIREYCYEYKEICI